MNILAILGSNRTDGVSAKVLAIMQRHLIGTAKVNGLWLKDYRIEHCDADNACRDVDCAVDDDVRKIVSIMQSADAILYVPVMHAYGTNSRFQSFMERVGYGYFRNRGRPLKDKLAGVAVVGRRYGHTGVFSQVVLNILLNKMILVGAGFPPTFCSQFLHDSEAEHALLDTLDRMVEFHGLLNEKVNQRLVKAKILEQVRIQTG